MKQTCVVSAIFLLSATMIFAGEAKKTGILIDAMCGEMSAANAEKVANHKVACALMPNCQESGFGIVLEGKFLKFDQAGDEKALQLLKNTKKTDKMKVEVTGDFEGDTVKVSKIEEVE
ncbi:hypothetical protein MYX84_05505 [Acidobacteria bacterium AH-259-O06]|nr:hypothetical protein [Acidobacteria bacterium AH-259-O06]